MNFFKTTASSTKKAGDDKYVSQTNYFNLIPQPTGRSTLIGKYPEKNNNKYSNPIKQIHQSAPIRPIFEGLSTRQNNIVAELQKQYKTKSPNQLKDKIFPIFDQLGVQYDKQNIPDCVQLANIICLILQYPSEKSAQVHRSANRLGNLDIKTKKQSYLNSLKCKCCHKYEQKQQINCCTSLDRVKNIGISTHLYFLTIKNIFLLLLLLLAVFSLFSVTTNFMSSKIYKQSFNGKQPQNSRVNTYSGFLQTSIGSKNFVNNHFSITTTQIQCWLGLLFTILWIVVYVFIKKEERQLQAKIDYQQTTIADYTLLFEKMPRKTKKEQLQNQLKQYVNQIKEDYPDFCKEYSELLQKEIKIQKINKTSPFYLESSIYNTPVLNKLKKKFENQKQQIRNLLRQRQKSKTFQINLQERYKKYAQFYDTKRQKQLSFNQFGKKLIQKQKQESAHKSKLDIFVTFKYTQNKELLQRLHQRQSSLIYNTCCFATRSYFEFYDQKQEITQPIIIGAPQPEDVKWISLSRSNTQIVLINALSFSITLVILLLTFFIVFTLTMIQVHYRMQSQKNNKDILSTLLSFGISIIITVFNIIISIILSYLTKMERNERYSHQQNSIGFKTVIATLINIVLIPLAASFAIKGNIYGIDGLADDVFFLALSNAIVSPIVKLINPSFVINRLKNAWKNRISSKIYLSQDQINIYNQNVDFEVGTFYAGIISLYLFTCFFASLQPLIVPISMIGLVLTYFSSRYNLYKNCKRPILGNNLINIRMHQLIAFGPLLYAVGSILWVNLPSRNEVNIIPNVLALILSVIAALFPFRQFTKKVFKKNHMLRSQIYSKDKAHFLTQYDIMNPLTQKDAIQEQKKQKISKNQNNRQQYFKRTQQPSLIQQTEERPIYQSFKGLAVSNTTDKLNLAQLFEGIQDNGLYQDSNSQKGQIPYHNIYIHNFPDGNQIQIQHMSNVQYLNIPKPQSNLNQQTQPSYGQNYLNTQVVQKKYSTHNL